MAEPVVEDKITLNVFVEDDKPAQIFKITIALQDDFDDVGSVIQQVYWEKQQISIYGLELYKANISPKQVSNAQLSDETLLQPLSTVASEWPSKSDVDRSLVHIIVRPRSRQITNTHSAVAPPSPKTESQQLLHEFKTEQLRLVENVWKNKESSSTAAHHKNFRMQQEGSDYINIGRPADKVGLPIVLYHPVFGRFLKRLQSNDLIDQEVYHLTAAHFLVSQDLYAGETNNSQARDNLTRSSLGRLLGDVLQKIKVRGVEADGVMAGPHTTYIKIMEMKNEIGMGGSDPSIQVALSYLRYWSDPEARRWLEWCCCPSILIAIAGPWMCILGAIFLDRPVVQPLTDFLWVGEDPARPSALDHIARVFDCIRKAREELMDYYITSYPPPSGYNIARPYPYLTRYLDSTQQPVHFTYRRPLCPKNPTKAIFLAETVDKENRRPIIVKFVQSYNSDAHKLLAEHKLAPELLYDGTKHPEDQPGPEHAMIVMDFVQGADLGSLGSLRLARSVLGDVEKAINLLHSDDYVFGDLREPNVMVLQDSTGNATGKAMLVDFDWCGKHRVGRYPPRMNMELGWHRDVDPGAVMDKEHDLHMLGALGRMLMFSV